MSWNDINVTHFAQTPKDYYEEMAQEWINDYFYDTTLATQIEEECYPFNEKYKKYEVHIDSVSEISVNIDKTIGDYISVLFKDCKHRNYRGQKYIYKNDTYLCYDKINNLSKVSYSKLIRCNNQISWVDKTNGNILTEKVFVGYEISSTNPQVSKSMTVENRRLVMYIQNNERTKDFIVNQRFMFEHNQCFKIEEINNYNCEQGLDKPTLIKAYIAYSPMLPTDNKELNVCDYYNIDYKIDIDQTHIEQVNGFVGKLNAVVLDKNDNVVDIDIEWSTSDFKVVSVTDQGVYTINGKNGDIAQIKATLKGNKNVYSCVTLSVVDEIVSNSYIIVNPNQVDELFELDSVDIECGVYVEGVRQETEVLCVASGVNQSNYKIDKINNIYKLTNLGKSKSPLKLTFSADECDDYIMYIKLKGLI